jgi:hypothetical protein
VEEGNGEKNIAVSSFFKCADSTNEVKDPDIPPHKQKELSECDEMVNYPVYRTSFGDFQV